MSGKRYVQPIVVEIKRIDGTVNLVNGKPQQITMAEFVDSRVIDLAFGGETYDAATVYAGVRVTQAFHSNANGKVVELDEDDYQRLLRATVSPRNGYNPEIAASFVPLLHAIEDAKREP